jgi:regulator of sigma E protease
LALVLFVLVVVHEYGHYKAAKIFGARVDEFGFGYPPKIATLFKRGETAFTLNLLPFGGFVKIFGEDDLGKESSADSHRALFNKPRWQQAIVLCAGVFMNIFLAGLLFSFGLMIGLPSSVGALDKHNKVTENIVIVDVEPGKPGALSLLQPKDEVVKITLSNQNIEFPQNTEDFKKSIQKSEGKEIVMTIKRDGQLLDKKLTPIFDTENNIYRAGLGLDTVGTVKLSFFKALVSGFKITFIILGDIFKSLFSLIGGLFTGNHSPGAEVTGPVGLVKSVGRAASFGFSYVISLTALISLNLAAINILPIPALDGGRLFFLLIEKIKGSRIQPKLANMLNSGFFFLLVGLMLLVTVFDVLKLFK